MPDALSILLNMQSPSNVGADSTPYVPNINRNNARTAALAKYLGLPVDDGTIPQSDLESAYSDFQAEADADEARKAANAQALETVKGRNAAAVEQMKAQYGLQTELEKEKLAESKLAQQQAFTHAENEARNAAVNARQENTITGQNQRSANYQGGMTARQGIAQREARAKALLSGKEQPEYPPTNGLRDNLKYYLGIGPYDRTTAAQKQAADLRAQNVGAVANPMAGMSFEDFTAQVLHDYPDATPEEIQQWFNEVNGGR